MIKKICLFIGMFLIFNVNVNAETVEQNIDIIIARLNEYESSYFLDSHPVGSIYVTVSPDENTIARMNSKYGGTWEVYGDGRVLKGTTGTSGTTGGSSTVTLTTSNIPSHAHSIPTLSVTIVSGGGHTHTLTAKGTVTSTFKGSSVTTASTSKTLAGGFEMHNSNRFTFIHTVSGVFSSGITNSNSYFTPISIGGQNGAPSIGILSIDASHTHSVTPAGTVNSTFSGTEASSSSSGTHLHDFVTETGTNTGSTGSSSPSSFGILDPYITVYMYKRIG